jgi:glutamate-5-semialdehyde dehydrogenase
MNLEQTFQQVKGASRGLVLMSDEQKNRALMAVADAIEAHRDALLAANAEDLARMEPTNPLYDRLQLTSERLAAIADDMRHVAQLPSPLGRETNARVLPNGLRLRRVSVAFGVVGVVYEARPNVTFDVFALCLKSGNACVLKGGRDAQSSNTKAVEIIRNTLREMGIDEHVVALLPATHEATAEMLSAVGYIDVCIPRGGRRLIDFVRDNARVPVIETGAGVVNTYFDLDCDLNMGRAIVTNAKTRRVSVCNALDCLIIHRERIWSLPALCEQLAEKHVTIYADERSFGVLKDVYPMVYPAGPDSFGTEFMDYKIAVCTVDSLQEAMDHIARYGSGHSESIVTDDPAAAAAFQAGVDAACVYVNAPTSFTDGAQFGLGAEIGISTQKLGARGPMGLEELTTYKWLIEGNGQTRP